MAKSRFSRSSRSRERKAPPPQMEIDAILSEDEIRTLHVDAIEEDQENPRDNNPDPEGLDRLLKSIQHKGVLEPVSVVELGNDTFQLRAGFQRWTAVKMLHAAGLCDGTLPARVIHDEARGDAIREFTDMIRSDLSAMQKARWLKRRAESNPERGWQTELAKKLGFTRSWINNYMALNEINQELQRLGMSNVIQERQLLIKANNLPPKALKKFLALVNDDKMDPKKALTQVLPKKKPKPPSVSIPTTLIRTIAEELNISLDSEKPTEILKAIKDWAESRPKSRG